MLPASHPLISAKSSTSESTSTEELKTSLNLLVAEPPVSCFFTMALGKVLCHALSHRISCSPADVNPQWIDDACDSLREAGADKCRVELVAGRLRALAMAHLPALMLDVVQNAGELECFTATIKQQWREAHPTLCAESSMHPQPAVAKAATELSASPAHASSKGKETAAPDHAPSKPPPRNDFDPVLFAASDQGQRQVLARKCFSLPIELFFYHVRRALKPDHDPSSEQMSLIWSKLTEQHTVQWQDLFDQLYRGDTVAAERAGTELLVEHEVLQKLKPTNTNLTSQELPYRSPETALLSKQSAQGQGQPLVRPAMRSTVRASRQGVTKSPYF
ncbi:hypothetical protein CBER1_10265 [Cercospora berteroae]|uniref:Uncharacterized protein n=1 Tax=Cercospora berteroae TaxID=357750 RepID=A0A2S6BXR7_9PEZI|nr:hypothetical protein CBER1_10265 [Cercospora berteroae]